MSDAESSGAIESAKDAYRTVTPPYVSRPDAEMDTIGWGYALGMILLLLPFLPIIVVVWVLSKVIDRIAPSRPSTGRGE
jgi:hypothetical protein